eukprot:3812009-Rhodomonas_salina.2
MEAHLQPTRSLDAPGVWGCDSTELSTKHRIPHAVSVPRNAYHTLHQYRHRIAGYASSVPGIAKQARRPIAPYATSVPDIV